MMIRDPDVHAWWFFLLAQRDRLTSRSGAAGFDAALDTAFAWYGHGADFVRSSSSPENVPNVARVCYTGKRHLHGPWLRGLRVESFLDANCIRLEAAREGLFESHEALCHAHEGVPCCFGKSA